MDQLIDFTLGSYGYRDYGGSDSKISIELSGKYYMIKRPQKLAQHTDLQSSYANNVLSEYLGSHIMQSLGIETHKTYLGIYNGEVVVGCLDFCEPDERNVEFATFMREIYAPDEIGRFPTYYQLYEVFEKNPRLSGLKEVALKRYWQEFVGDALIGNFDRHKGNFGFIVNAQKRTVRVSPVYDNGSSLYANLSELQMPGILSDPKEIEKRLFVFPSAALNKNINPHKEEKFGYYELLSGEFYDKNCAEALQEIYPRIRMDEIDRIVDETPIISEIRKQFYKEMLHHRMNRIITPAYEKIRERETHWSRRTEITPERDDITF